MEALKSQSPATRKSAVQALRRMGRKAKPAVPALLDALADPSREVRCFAAIALPYVDPSAAEPAIPLLVECVGSPELWFQEGAAAALMLLGAKAAPAIPALIEALKTGDLDVETDKDGAEAVVRLLCCAATCLGNCGGQAMDAVQELRRLLDREPAILNEHTGDFRDLAREALGKIEGADDA